MDHKNSITSFVSHSHHQVKVNKTLSFSKKKENSLANLPRLKYRFHSSFHVYQNIDRYTIVHKASIIYLLSIHSEIIFFIDLYKLEKERNYFSTVKNSIDHK